MTPRDAWLAALETRSIVMLQEMTRRVARYGAVLGDGPVGDELLAVVASTKMKMN